MKRMRKIFFYNSVLNAFVKHRILLKIKNMEFAEDDKTQFDPAHTPPAAYSDSDLEALVDNLLTDMDKDHDGYVNWPEYRHSYD